jgi:hypothetical protein
LLIQKTERLYKTFLAPVQQPMVEKTYVAFDQIVQLIACDMPNIHSTAVAAAAIYEPLTLSVVVNEPHINRCREIDQFCGLSCAPASKLIARNSFVIRRPQHNNSIGADGKYLKYGQDFMLECYSCKDKSLRVYSMPKNPFVGLVDNVFKAHGEIKQFVGLAIQKINATDGKESMMESIPSSFFHWRMYHINPEIRYETIGENIPVCTCVC